MACEFHAREAEKKPEMKISSKIFVKIWLQTIYFLFDEFSFSFLPLFFAAVALALDVSFNNLIGDLFYSFRDQRSIMVMVSRTFSAPPSITSNFVVCVCAVGSEWKWNHHLLDKYPWNARPRRWIWTKTSAWHSQWVIDAHTEQFSAQSYRWWVVPFAHVLRNTEIYLQIR